MGEVGDLAALKLKCSRFGAASTACSAYVYARITRRTRRTQLPLTRAPSWTLLAKVGTELEDAAYSSLAPYNASHVAMVYERGYGASHVTRFEGDASRRGR